MEQQVGGVGSPAVTSQKIAHRDLVDNGMRQERRTAH